MLSRDQAKFTAHLCETVRWANSRPSWGPIGEYYVKIHEVGRTREQQELYVAAGVSWTMKSDHLEDRAADLQIYRRGYPLYAPEHYRPLADYFIALEPLYNYWGFYEWGKDTPHFGRRRSPVALAGGVTT